MLLKSKTKMYNFSETSNDSLFGLIWISREIRMEKNEKSNKIHNKIEETHIFISANVTNVR